MTSTTAVSLETVQMRAALDEEWRQQLLDDPTATLENLGVKLRDGVKIRIVEQADGELVLPVPPKAQQVVEVDEDSLANVSGGTILGVAATFIPEAVPAAGAGLSAAWGFGGVVVGGVLGWAGSHF